MAREDRSDDRGRSARRMGVKEWLQVIGLVLVALGVVWRGGQMSEQLRTANQGIDQVRVVVEALSLRMHQTANDVTAVQARQVSVEKEVGNHEIRLLRIEDRSAGLKAQQH